VANKITNVETLSISTQYRNMTISKVNGDIVIAITYPGDQRESSKTLAIEGLEWADILAIRDFLSKVLTDVGVIQ